MMKNSLFPAIVASVILMACGPALRAAGPGGPLPRASSLAVPVPAAGAPAWDGGSAGVPWVWEQLFPAQRTIGGLVQTLGNDPLVLRQAPLDYEWQVTTDGRKWRTLPETRVRNESRRVRTIRLSFPVRARGLRLVVNAARDQRPIVQKLDILDHPDAVVRLPPWVLLVNSTEDSTLPNHGQEFLPLVRSCPGYENVAAQQIWVTDLTPELLRVEPSPLAVFLSGTFKDWCQVDRSHWRGVERVLAAPKVPIWASCGGAQALAIIADGGTLRSWDCPHCRDEDRPKTPIYGHIGHTGPGPAACGDYSRCAFEKGPRFIVPAANEPLFEGMPSTFQVMESHCGQLMYAPDGWDVVAGGGSDALTRIQCLRLRGHYVYAAQFHIEMAGTPEVSRQLMRNFLSLARHSLTAP